jgi:hypothetical protein
MMPLPTALLVRLKGRLVSYTECTVHAFSGAVNYHAGGFVGQGRTEDYRARRSAVGANT